jgi:hypothetical protein
VWFADSNLAMAADAGDIVAMTVQEPYQRNWPSGWIALQYKSFSKVPQVVIFLD